MNKEVELGDKARDRITGYTGIVIGITVWLNGCRRFGLQAPMKKKEKLPDDGYWVDEGQVVLVQKRAFKKEKKKKVEPPGGPNRTPSREKDPTRP